MAAIINTNIASLNAQRNLSTSQSSLQTSLQRLSSGLRINSAKDDAAGMAISSRMTTQINGLNQASRNANDGISLAQTGEAALSEITNNLQRIRELSVQAANATNSASDRATLDQEVQQRIQEINRIATQTSFNGQKILDGTFGSATFQVGANVGETISVGLSTSMKTSAIGQYASGSSSVEVTTAALSGSGTIKVGTNDATTIAASVAGAEVGQTVGSAYAKAEAINNASVPGLTATATNNVEFTIANLVGSGTPAEANEYSLRINGEDIYNGFDMDTGGNLSAQQITDAINAASAKTGVTATLTGANLRLSAEDGRDIAIAETQGADVASGGLVAGAGGSTTIDGVTYLDGTFSTTLSEAAANSTTAGAVNGGQLTLTANENIVIAGDGAIMGFTAATTTIAKDTDTLNTVDVLTVSGANDTIQRIDAALESVSSLRSTFGAIQNRFESTIANLNTASENISAARSRILDADFAAETAAMTRAQILQQAGTAMLAQANSLPNSVLSLLQG